VVGLNWSEKKKKDADWRRAENRQGSVFLPGAKHSIRVPADYSQPACGVRCSAKPGTASQLPVFGVFFVFLFMFLALFLRRFCAFLKKKRGSSKMP
jgi:hypothetical protein